jgi:hypothetical protein
MSFYTRYLPAIPVATAPVGVASAARLPFFLLRLPSPIWPTPGLGSWSGTLAKVWVYMSAHHVVAPPGRRVGRQSVVTVGNWIGMSKAPTLGSLAPAWRAL